MNYLLDTNAVSEWVKPRPDPGVVEWLDSVDEDRVYLSVITLAEIRRGVERLPDSRRKARLKEWLERELPDRFEGRILPLDATSAHTWGRLLARAEATGRPMNAMDGFIAAIAEANGLTLVTRNAGHFGGLTLPPLNPWRG